MVRTKKILQLALAKAKTPPGVVGRKRKRESDSTAADHQLDSPRKKCDGKRRRSVQKTKKTPKLELKEETNEELKPQISKQIKSEQVGFAVLKENELVRSINNKPIARLCNPHNPKLYKRRSFDIEVFKSALRKFGRCGKFDCDPLMRRGGIKAGNPCCPQCSAAQDHVFMMFILSETPTDLLNRVDGAMNYVLQLVLGSDVKSNIEPSTSFSFVEKLVERLISSVQFVFTLDAKMVDAIKRSPLCTSCPTLPNWSLGCEVHGCSHPTNFRFTLKEVSYDRRTFRLIPVKNPRTFCFSFCRRHFDLFSMIHRAYHMFYNVFKNFDYWAKEQQEEKTTVNVHHSDPNGCSLTVKTEVTGQPIYPPGFQTMRDKCMSNIICFDFAHNNACNYKDSKSFIYERRQWKSYLKLWKSQAVLEFARRWTPSLIALVEKKQERLLSSLTFPGLGSILQNEHFR